MAHGIISGMGRKGADDVVLPWLSWPVLLVLLVLRQQTLLDN